MNKNAVEMKDFTHKGTKALRSIQHTLSNKKGTAKTKNFIQKHYLKPNLPRSSIKCHVLC